MNLKNLRESAMNYRDYKRLKVWDYQSVGMFGDNIYAYEVLTGFADIPEYYQITREEFDTYDVWKTETPGDLGILYEIVNRKPLCSAYKERTEIKEFSMEYTCPICGKSFLIGGGDISDNIDVSKICPVCNKSPEPKMDLMLEIKKQLDKAELRINNLGQVFTSYYINPWSKSDMNAYVEVGNYAYYLRVNERGQVIIEHRVTDVKKAAYWILKQLVYRTEVQRLSKEEQCKLEAMTIAKEKCKLHFGKMDKEYQDWYEQNIDYFNFEKINEE